MLTPATPTGRSSARLDEPTPATSEAAAQLTPTLPLSQSGRQAARARAVLSRLSVRDLEVLDTLAELRLLSGRHVQRLYLADAPPATGARRARAILKRLTDLRVVVRLDRRRGGVRAGSDGHSYGLSGLGRAVLIQSGRTRLGSRPLTTTRPAFQDHILAVSEVYVQLCEHERTQTPAVELLSFDGEPACWRRFPRPGGGLVDLKPDAFVALGVGEYEHQAFIEMDCGSESVPTVARKCQRYIDYWHSGLAQRDGGVFPRVWWIGPNPARCDQLQRAIASLPSEARPLFAVTTASEAAERLVQPDDPESSS